MNSKPPSLIYTNEQLDDILTRPSQALSDWIGTVTSPLVILGAGGKMGPSLAVLAQRAATAAGKPLQVVAVSRFTDTTARDWLEANAVRTLSCDLLERPAWGLLPDAENVVYLVGLKFGTSEKPWLTWAVNTLVPAHAAERYAHARMVALSTGNVYGLVPLKTGGAVETDTLRPAGEYANAALARERLFQYFSEKNGTPVVLIRLNYAVELRYGVLVDIATKVWSGEPVDVATGHLNCIWQGDANDFILRALSLANVSPLVLNLTGPEVLSVRELAGSFGELMNRTPKIVGTETQTALLSNAARLCARLGTPAAPVEQIVRWTAGWVMNGGRLLNKPTHFEVRDGQY
ncbi:MAG: NAD(P)-dependent oxidoreductase [Verrucomicrobiota bacterium]